MSKRDEALMLASAQGESTLREGNNVYTIKAHKQIPFESAKVKRVKMPGVTLEQLIESVHDMRVRA